MLDDIKDLTTELDRLDLDRDQKEAVFDVLLLVMEADRVADRDEAAFLDRIADACHWFDDPAMAARLAKCRQAVIEMVEGGGDIATFVRGARDRIHEPAAARAVYLLCDGMANADRTVDESEMAVLAAVVDAFADRTPDAGQR